MQLCDKVSTDYLLQCYCNATAMPLLLVVPIGDSQPDRIPLVCVIVNYNYNALYGEFRNQTRAFHITSYSS